MTALFNNLPLNGWKRTLALVILGVLSLLPVLGVTLPPGVEEFLRWLAGILGAVGVAHSVAKGSK